MGLSNTRKLEFLRANYRKNLQAYKNELQALWAGARQNSQNFSEMQSMAHRLAGSGQAYGLREISQTARDLERALEQTRLLSLRETMSAVSGPLDALLDELSRSSESYGEDAIEIFQDTDAPEEEARDEVNVLLLDDDEDFTDTLAHTLGAYGYCVRVEQDVTRLEQAVATHEPLALIVDMDFYGHRFAGAIRSMPGGKRMIPRSL